MEWLGVWNCIFSGSEIQIRSLKFGKKIVLPCGISGFSCKFRPLKNIFRTLENDHSIRHQSIPPLIASRFVPRNAIRKKGAQFGNLETICEETSVRWPRMSGRRTSGRSRPSLGVQVPALFSFLFPRKTPVQKMSGRIPGTPFLPPFFPHFSPRFPLQALCIFAPLLPSSPPPSSPPFWLPENS